MDKGFACRASDKLGEVRRLDDAVGRYVEFCKSTFPSHLDLKGMRLYLDCANGAAYHVAPAVFHALGADIDEQTTQHLCEIFQTCCLFDLRFWDMVYAMGET